MAKTIATAMGALFLLVGLVGLLGIADNIAGFHLSVAHDIVHILTGAVALYLGLRGTLSAARLFCIAFGGFYALLGIAGFVFGSDQPSSMPGMAMGNSNLLRIIPGVLEVARPITSTTSSPASFSLSQDYSRKRQLIEPLIARKELSPHFKLQEPRFPINFAALATDFDIADESRTERRIAFLLPEMFFV